MPPVGLLCPGDCRRYPGGTENTSILRTVSRWSSNTREASRMLIPSTITALRTRRYTSTLYIHHTIHGFGYNPMNDGGRYSIQSPFVSMVRINVRLSGQHKCHLCYPRG